MVDNARAQFNQPKWVRWLRRGMALLAVCSAVFILYFTLAYDVWMPGQAWEALGFLALVAVFAINSFQYPSMPRGAATRVRAVVMVLYCLAFIFWAVGLIVLAAESPRL